jgi:enamine deaminase RidA (YjgF/YER057c/UK114 family)
MSRFSTGKETTMIKHANSLYALLGAAALGFAAAPALAQAPTPSPHMEIINHPNYDKTVNMPFSPAIKIKSGKILWLAGTTALPVYHDHPHKRDQIQQYMVNDLEAQTRRAMDGIKATLEASGASFKDVVHYFVFRARPRMGDIGKASGVIASYFAPYNHKPTSTNVAVLELGEPEQLIEIQMFAVVD